MSDDEEFLDGAKSYILVNPFLNSIGFCYHTHFHILICTKCEVAWDIQNIKGHLKQHKIFPGAQFEENLTAFVDEHLVVNSSMVITPKPGGPPVECLQSYEGFQCQLCNYAARKLHTMQTHHSNVHSKIGYYLSADRWTSTTVQTFYNPIPLRYFMVNPSLAKVSSDKPYTIFVRDILPTLQAVYHPPSEEPPELPPLIQMTGWASYLNKHRLLESKKALRALIAFTSLPSSHEGILKSIEHVVWTYMNRARAMILQADYIYRRMLLCCPV